MEDMEKPLFRSSKRKWDSAFVPSVDDSEEGHKNVDNKTKISMSDDGAESSEGEPDTFSGAPWENPQLSEYEKMVLKNIESRNKFMVEKGFPEAVRDLSIFLPSKVKHNESPKEQSPLRKKVVHKKVESPLPRREPSRRIRQLAAKKEEDVKKEVEDEEGKENAEWIDNRLLESTEMGDEMACVMKHSSENAVYNPNLNLADCSLTEYRDQLLSLTLIEARKVMPGWIQSMHTHPQTSKLVILAGDKYGNFGVWDPVVGDGEPTVHQVHRAPLNCISVARDDPSKVYTTGHDGAVVQTDFLAGKFTNVFATDWSERVTHLTWHNEFRSRQFLVAHGRGDVGILDLRAGKDMQEWIDCFPKSVRTVQHHPTQEDYFVVASGFAGSFKIFDLRNSEKCLCEVEHSKGVTSAFFSPGGNRIVSTSNDDRIRVFDSTMLKSELPTIACYSHNNFTGRWLTSFRADWVPQRDDVFHVGSLLKPRRMQFYRANDGGILCDVFHDEVETVCSVITMHPTLPVFAGANSSGKVHLFGPSELKLEP